MKEQRACEAGGACVKSAWLVRVWQRRQFFLTHRVEERGGSYYYNINNICRRKTTKHFLDPEGARD